MVVMQLRRQVDPDSEKAGSTPTRPPRNYAQPIRDTFLPYGQLQDPTVTRHELAPTKLSMETCLALGRAHVRNVQRFADGP